MDKENVCVVKSCRFTTNPTCDRRFFKFPLHDKSLTLTWLLSIGYDHTFNVTQNTLICSAHFSITDYVLENGCFELCDSAIPTQYKYEAAIIDNDDIDYCTPNNSTSVINMLGYYNQPHSISNGETHNYNETNTIANSSLSNIRTTSHLKNIPGVSNQMYLLTNTNEHHNDLSSNIYSSEIVGNNTNTNFQNTPAYIKTYKNPRNKSIPSLVTVVPKTSDLPTQVINLPKYKHDMHVKCCKKLKLMTLQNERLLSKIRKMATRQHDILDFKIKYLELKERVLETEEQLLNSGIDTTKYSAFNRIDDVPKIPPDVGYDMLLECKLEEVNEQLASTSHSVSGIDVQALSENNTSVPEYSNGLNS